MNDKVYWLWLQGVFGYAKDVKELIETFGTAKNIFYSDKDELKDSGVKVLTSYRISKIKSETLDKYFELLELCNKHKIHILTPDSEYYPRSLLDINNFPLVLYVRGDYTCLNSSDKTFAVIGSRTPSLYGENAARSIIKTLCNNNALIVSGGALGIDTITHQCTIENGCKTVLVMGCGHGNNYLPQNSDLRKAVSKSGALITEYPPLSAVGANTFPERNRIISGMSKGVVICEAAEYSGTFSTAKHALKQGRDLFVLPGDIESGNFAGSNKLIAEGAKAIFSGEEILRYYDESFRKVKKFLDKTGDPFKNIDEDASSTKKRQTETKTKTDDKIETTPAEEKNKENIVKINAESVSKNAFIVYNILSDGVIELDDIVRSSYLEVRKVLVALTELEMLGAAECNGPNRYRLKNLTDEKVNINGKFDYCGITIQG